MSRMRSRSILLYVLIALALTGCGERPELRYRTLEEALKANGSDDWFYSALPRSSHDIVEKYDMDTNEVWGRFRFRGDDGDAFTRMTRVEPQEMQNAAIRNPGNVSWWPKELVGSIDAEALARSGLKFFKYSVPPHQNAPPQVAFFAVNVDQGIAYFWEKAS